MPINFSPSDMKILHFFSTFYNFSLSSCFSHINKALNIYFPFLPCYIFPKHAIIVLAFYKQFHVELQVSGLKSITSKHLALASQVISFIYAIIPGKLS